MGCIADYISGNLHGDRVGGMAIKKESLCWRTAIQAISENFNSIISHYERSCHVKRRYFQSSVPVVT